MKFLNKLSKNQKIKLITILIIVLSVPAVFIINLNTGEDKFSFITNSENILQPSESSTETQNENQESESSEENTNDNTSRENGSESSKKSTNQSTTNKSQSLKSGASTAGSSSASHSYLPSPRPVSAGHNIVGYYMGWSRYKGIAPESLDTSKITHLNYAFANISSDLNIAFADESNDLKNFESLRNLKSNNKNLRTLISVGGWDYSKYFSDAALNDTNRSIFAQNCLNFILKHGFDGIDIDWESPVSGGSSANIYRAEDKQNYTLLLKAIREKLNEQKSKDGRNYYLTATGGISVWYLNNIECKKVSSYVDYIFVMAYDLNGPWDEYANFNAPLYSRSDFSASGGNVSGGLNNYLNAGVSASKIVLGVPFYGYRYTLVNTENNGIGSKFSGASSITYDAVVSDYLNNSNYTNFFDETARVPYIFGSNTFISYENEQSISEKATLAKNKGFSGVGAWEISFDKDSKLISAINSIFK